MGRIWLRVQMYVLYPLKLILRQLFNRKPGVDVVCTNTFYAPLICALFRPKKRPVIHLVYDLFPDALFIGKGKPPQRIHRLMDRLVKKTFQKCSANVFLGEHLLAHAESRFGGIPNAQVIPVGADASVFAAKSPPLRSGDPVRFLYCGNMGFLHDAETLAKGICSVVGSRSSVVGSRSSVVGSRESESGGLKVRFRICASGAKFNEFKEELRECGEGMRTPNFKRSTLNVQGGDFDVRSSTLDVQRSLSPSSLSIEGSLGDADWVEAMSGADVALVSMVPDAGKVVMPSKTYSAMAAGQAILAIAPEDSDLAGLIRKHDCGWRVDPGDAEGFAEAVQEIVSNPEELSKKRENALRVARGCYDVAVIAEEWEGVLKMMTSEPRNDVNGTSLSLILGDFSKRKSGFGVPAWAGSFLGRLSNVF